MTVNDQQRRSWYEHTASRRSFPALEGDVQADVCIVGGGYTGMGAALELSKAGLNVVVLEAGEVASGASGSNGGQFCTGMRQDQEWLEKRCGKAVAQEMWDIAEEAKRYVHGLCDEYKIDYLYQPGMVYLATKARDVEGLKHHADYLADHYGYDKIEVFGKERCSEFVGSEVYHGGIHDSGAGHVHPLRMALGLVDAAASEGAQIFEQSRVTRYEKAGDKVKFYTSEGMVEANYAVLACNGYIGDLEPELAARIMPVNDFLIATEPLGDLADELIPGGQALADTKYHLEYYRLSHDKRMLFAGGASARHYSKFDIEQRIAKNMHHVFPQLKNKRVEFEWSGTLAITVNQMPHYGVLKDKVFFAHGYSGQGVILAIMSGRILAEAIKGQSRGLNVMESIKAPKIPGGAQLRKAAVMSAMAMYKVLDAI